jgi:hypothetical protein
MTYPTKYATLCDLSIHECGKILRMFKLPAANNTRKPGMFSAG